MALPFRLTRRSLVAAAAAPALATGWPQRVRAAGNLPPELILAGAPDDYIGYVFIQRYFPQTGHNVDGEILNYFRAAGEIEAFGYPLTEEYWEPDGVDGAAGRMVQYFQRARLEYRAPAQTDPDGVAPPELDEGDGETGEDEGATDGGATDRGAAGEGTVIRAVYRDAAVSGAGVRRSPLGEALLPNQPAVPPGPGVRYFPETGHNVGGAFLRFFVAAGGADVLGLPLSEEVPQNGHTAQWFQNARLEWWPENPPGEQVQFGLIGQEHLQLAVRYVPASALQPAPPKEPLRQWILPPPPPAPARWVPPQRIPILYYHQVPSQGALRSQIQAFKEAGRQFVSLGRVVDALRGEASLPPNPLVLTFDDGWATQFANAAPVLQAERVPATFFVITRYLGTIPGYMTWDQVRVLKELGHEVESHTQNHADVVALRRQNEGAAIAEIWESLSILESRLGHSRRLFAYPNGTWDARTARIVARVYRGAVATGGGDLQSQDRLYALRRIKAEPSYDPESLLGQM
jgi:peptidoglycan/xylan/chitin deacetylase (PgdA/CDA1 family)